MTPLGLLLIQASGLVVQPVKARIDVYARQQLKPSFTESLSNEKQAHK